MMITEDNFTEIRTEEEKHNHVNKNKPPESNHPPPCFHQCTVTQYQRRAERPCSYSDITLFHLLLITDK